MPVHDWTRVDAGIFHHFHLGWIGDLSRMLNRGRLPPDHYALTEQVAGGVEPDVITLQYRSRAEPDAYAFKARSVAIRHVNNHKVVALVQIVSPGNKNTRHGLRAFVEEASKFLRASIHLVVLDLFPTGPRDPQGIHKAIWDEIIDNDFTLPAGKPLTLVSYIGGGLISQAFIEPTAVGEALPEMPLFLTPDFYVPLPLEATYQSAWEAIPSYWQNVLTTCTGV